MAKREGKGGGVGAGFSGETELIRTVFAPLAQGAPGAFDLMDDAALFSPRAGEEAVLTTDVVVAGVHFLPDMDPADIGYKALAVNVSDLVAKGADPDVYLLSIALPGTPDADWLGGLREGFAEAQSDFGCRLVGGDTVRTPGPLTLSVTALGRLPEGTMVHRFAARPGDRVYVSGTIGDAAAGLRLLQTDDAAMQDAIGADGAAYLAARYRRPRPFPGLAWVIRGHARAAMDVSDGLAGDFAKMCAASGCGGMLRAEKVPFSGPAQALLETGHVSLADVVTGGDDYEVLAAVPVAESDEFEAAARAAGRPVRHIGEIRASKEVAILGADGRPMRLAHPGYDHFRA